MTAMPLLSNLFLFLVLLRLKLELDLNRTICLKNSLLEIPHSQIIWNQLDLFAAQSVHLYQSKALLLVSRIQSVKPKLFIQEKGRIKCRSSTIVPQL